MGNLFLLSEGVFLFPVLFLSLSPERSGVFWELFLHPSMEGSFLGCCHLQFGLQTKLATVRQCKSWHMTANAMGWARVGSPHVIGLGLGRSPQLGYEEFNLCSLLEASRLGEVVEYDFKSQVIHLSSPSMPESRATSDDSSSIPSPTGLGSYSLPFYL